LIKGPAEQEVEAKLSIIDSEYVKKTWQKVLARKHSDPEGAITASRTLIETVCKHILDDAKIEYPDSVDLPKLYYLVAENLNLAPNQHTTRLIKNVLGNSQAVVNGLAAIRNSMGDAHGKSSNEANVDPIHAELAANLAGAMTTFIISMWETSSLKLNEDSEG
jgi:hypothetical protein